MYSLLTGLWVFYDEEKDSKMQVRSHSDEFEILSCLLFFACRSKPNLFALLLSTTHRQESRTERLHTLIHGIEIEVWRKASLSRRSKNVSHTRQVTEQAFLR